MESRIKFIGLYTLISLLLVVSISTHLTLNNVKKIAEKNNNECLEKIELLNRKIDGSKNDLLSESEYKNLFNLIKENRETAFVIAHLANNGITKFERDIIIDVNSNFKARKENEEMGEKIRKDLAIFLDENKK